MSRIARRIGSIALATTLTAVTFAAIAIAGLSQPASSNEGRQGTPAARPAPARTPAPNQLVVAIVLGQTGTDTTDAFAPYEVFSSSPSFFVYTVAASAEAAPVDGSMAVLPDHTFDEVASGAAPRPDLVVVPAVNDPADAQEAGARDFISSQYHAGARILGVCAGSRLLAASGVLDGLRATSHWSRISALTESNPEVTWVTGERFVQDGRVTTTGGVTSGIPGSLRVLADMAGDAEAARIGNTIRYPGWSPDASTAMPAQGFGFEDAPLILNTVFPWGRPSVGVELRDGVGEIDVASILAVYTYSQAATAAAYSRTGSITTQHGIEIRTATSVSSSEVSVVAGQLGAPGSEQGLDAAFELLSRSAGSSVVRSASKMLEYPIYRVTPEVAPWDKQVRAPLLVILSLAVAVGVGLLPLSVSRWVRRARTSATAGQPTTERAAS